MRVIIPLAGNVIANLLAPARGRARLENRINQALNIISSKCAGAKDLAELLHVFEFTATSMPSYMMPALVGGIAGGQAPLQILLRRLDFPGSRDMLFDLTRGLPYNVTTQMDLQLWETARAIKSDKKAAEYFISADTETLVSEFRQGKLPSAAQNAITEFLSHYDRHGQTALARKSFKSVSSAEKLPAHKCRIRP
jgi:pyruvate,water dikinase